MERSKSETVLGIALIKLMKDNDLNSITLSEDDMDETYGIEVEVNSKKRSITLTLQSKEDIVQALLLSLVDKYVEKLEAEQNESQDTSKFN